jgi:hypothetical protein
MAISGKRKKMFIGAGVALAGVAMTTGAVLIGSNNTVPSGSTAKVSEPIEVHHGGVPLTPFGNTTTGQGSLTLCSNGGFDSYFQVPDRGGMASFIVNNGQCRAFDYKLSANEQIKVFKASNEQEIGAPFSYNPNLPYLHTVAGPGYYVSAS